MSGYVARLKGGLGLDADDLEFMMDKKHPRKEKIFKCRRSCMMFFHDEWHLSMDDLSFLFWFEEGEDIKRNLRTGKIADPYYKELIDKELMEESLMEQRKFTEEQIQEELDKISKMSRIDMCRIWRFAPIGSIYTDSTLPFCEAFKKRLFDELGGFSPEISKELGW